MLYLVWSDCRYCCVSSLWQESRNSSPQIVFIRRCLKVSIYLMSTTSHNRSHVHDTIASKGQVVASIYTKDWECWCNGISTLRYLAVSRFEYRLHSRVNRVHFWIFSVLTDLMIWNKLLLPAPRSLLRPTHHSWLWHLIHGRMAGK
jgi:hypothetical protein